MSNLRTNLFQGDLYIESSLDPTIYGSGNLNIDGDLTIAGTFSSVGGSTFNTLIINGTTSGTISIKPQAVAGTYNFNLPITSGTNGQVLTSAGGGASAMTWTTPTTGTVTSIALSVPTFLSVAGSPITSSGTLAVTLSGTALPILNGGTGSTTATGTGSVVLQTSPTLTTPIIGAATGTSLSLTGNVNSLTQSITGSSSGVITIRGQAVAGTYNFNLPITSGTSGQVLTSAGGVSSAMTWTTLTTGTVTNVALTVPSFLSVAGSPITSSGTLAVSLSGTALPILNGGTGSTTATGSGSVVLQTSPTLVTPVLGAATGTSLSVTGNINSLIHTITGSTSGVITIQGQASAGTYNFNLPITSGTTGQVLTSAGGGASAMTWSNASTGTVTSIALTVPSFLSVAGSPITSSGTLAVTLSGTALPILNGGTGSTTATGSGSVVLQTSPTLVTPNIGAATGTSLSVTGQLTSTLANGTAPLVVTSTTLVTNLNANYLGNATFASPAIIGSGTPNSATFTTLRSTTSIINGSISGSITIQGQSASGTYNFNLPTTSGTSGQVLTSAGGVSAAMTWTTPTTGTVTSIALTVPSFLSVAGSPITSSGTLAVTLSGTALPILNGGTGSTTATGSGSVVLQISPTLVTPVLGVATGTSLSITGNVNSLTHTITGSTSGVITITGQSVAGTYNFILPTSSGTSGQVLTSGGGGTTAMTWSNVSTGTVTSVALTVPTFLSITGSPITSSGTLAVTLSGTALPILNGGTGSTTATGSGSVVLQTSPTLVTPVLGVATGTSLSVTSNINSLTHTITGSTSGVITIQGQATAGIYNFNLPTSSGTSGQVLTSGGGGATAMTWTNVGVGTVTSVALTVPTFLSIAGSPITSSGTLAVTLSGTALPILNGGTGSTTATGSGSVVLQSSPTLTTPVLGTATGTSLSVTGNVNSLTHTITGSTSGVITIQGQAVAGTYNFNLPTTSGTSGQVLTSAGGVSSAMTWTTPTTGTVTSVSLSVPSFLSVAGSPITTSGTLAVTLSGTALPILNGGTGSTTATGSGSVVLQNTPTLITPNIGVATGTSLSLSSNLTVNGITTINGPGTSGATSNAGLYVNPTGTILSGANSYFYSFFAIPQTTGSTTGSGSTLYIEGAPTNTTDPYALFIGSGFSYFGGRLSIATSIDTPAINPDAYNTLIIYEDQTQPSTPYSGILTGSATYSQNNYIQLTTTAVTNYGQIYWRRHPGNAFSATFEIYNGTTGGNGITFYWFSTTIPGTSASYNTGITSAYSLVFEDYASGTTPGTSLWYNGVQLGSTVANISTLTNSQFNKVTVIFIRDTIRVFINGTLIINYQDIVNRAPTNLNAFIGFYGYNVNLGNFHRLRNIRISKTNEGLLEYTSPTSADMFINATNVGIGTQSPGYPLHVSGAIKGTNLLTNNIDLSGTTSGTISIKPQATTGTYNFNLPITAGTSGQVLTSGGGVSSAMTWSSVSTGTVTSVALTVPSFLSIAGSPITTSGTLAITLSGTALPILNGGTGSTTATGTGSVVLQTSPTLTTPVLGAATGTSLSVTGNVNSRTQTITGSSSGIITIQSQAVAGTYNFNLPTTSGTSGQVLTSTGGGATAMTWTNVGVGTVTSVALTVPTFLSVAGSPITASGTLAVTLSGIALPIANGGTGSTTATGSGSVVLQNTPTLTTPILGVATGTSVSVTGNVNSLTQSITGSTSGVITIQGQATAGTYNFNLPITSGISGQVLTSGGGVSSAMTWTTPTTGTVTSIALTVPTFLSISGSPITTSGTLAVTLSGTALPIANGGTGTTTATGSGSVVLQNTPTLTTPILGVATGTSVSVTGNVNSLTQSITGSTSGVITIQGQAAAGTYNFNLPTSSGTSGQVLTSGGGVSSAMTWTTPTTGTVTSIALTVPTFLSISGSPITTSGTLAVTLSGTALPIANGGTGSTTATGSGSVVLQTSPTLTTPTIGVATGTSLSLTGNVNSLTHTITGSTSGVITIQGQATAGTYNFNLPISSGTSGQVLTSGGGVSSAMTWTTPTTGTVTSIALTVPTFLSISGSPITTSGTLAVTLSGTALPIANGGTGSTTATGSGSVVLQTSPILTTPVLGAATGTSVSVTGNVNSLTHTITGSTSGVITIQGQATAGTYNFNLPTTAGTSGQVLTSAGGVSAPMTWTTPTTGTVTSIALTVPTFLSISGSPITTSGTLAVTLSGTALPIANGGTGTTTATGSGSVVLQNTPTLTTPILGVATGTSVSVTGNMNSLTHTITGSTSGVITIQGQATAGTYNFNLPITSGTSGQVLTSGGGVSSAMTWTTPTTGTVTSVALSVPSFLSIAGSPITTSGTLAVTLSGTALPIANGGTGSTTATGSGSVVLQTSPTLTTPIIGVATGTSLSVTGNMNSLTHTITGSTSGVITIQSQAAAGTYNFNLPTTAGTSGQVLTSAGGVSAPMTWTTVGGSGTVTSVALTVPSFLSISGSPITTSGTLAVTLSGTALPILNGGTGSTTATGTGSVVLQNTPTLTTPNIGVATGTSVSVTGNVNSLTQSITGSTSGVITIQGQATAGTYNFNLPTTSGTSGQILTSAGGVSSPMTWTTKIIRTVWIISDQKASGTNGGTFTNGAFQTRLLNTITSSQVNTAVTLAANTITITPGTYYVEASVPAYKCGNHVAQLFNSTNSTVVAFGTNATSATGDNTTSNSFIKTTITVATTTNYIIRHRGASIANTTGFGIATGFGLETYTLVKVEEII